MDDGYLPDYYIRKKQRDRMYTGIWKGVLVLAVCVAGIFAGIFAFNVFGISWKMRGQPTVNKVQADELNALQTEERINNAIATQEKTVGDLSDADTSDAATGDTPGAAESTALDPMLLAGVNADISEIEYSESFPLVTVSLEASSTPGQPRSGAEGTSPAGQSAEGGDSAAASTESTAVRTDDKDKPADNEDKKPEQDKPPKDTQAEKQVISTKIYHVYAAEVTSKEQAQDVVKRLADHGYQGQIIEQNPYFLIKVLQTRRGEEARALMDKLKQLGFDPIPTVSNAP